MPERKNLAKIDVITDCDTGNYHIGEVDGSFSESELRDHIKRHGHQEICAHLAYLQYQVWDCLRQLNSEKDYGQAKVGQTPETPNSPIPSLP